MYAHSKGLTKQEIAVRNNKIRNEQYVSSESALLFQLSNYLFSKMTNTILNFSGLTEAGGMKENEGKTGDRCELMTFVEVQLWLSFSSPWPALCHQDCRQLWKVYFASDQVPS